MCKKETRRLRCESTAKAVIVVRDENSGVMATKSKEQCPWNEKEESVCEKKGRWVCVYLEEEATQPVEDGLDERCHGE